MGIRRVRVVDPYDLKATEEVVTEELAAPEPSVIITRAPACCSSRWRSIPLPGGAGQVQGLQDVHADRMSRISWKDKKAVIDPTQCVAAGCVSSCVNLTPFFTAELGEKGLLEKIIVCSQEQPEREQDPE